MARTDQQAGRSVGRPKTRPDDYHQHSVWLPGSLQADVWHALVMPNGKRFQFSRLVESLLRRWLEAGGKLPKE